MHLTSGPQLKPEQARLFEIDEVLKYVGEAGKEKIDPWMPLNDPLVKDTKFNADYRVNRALKADGKTVFHTIQAAIQQAAIDGRKFAQQGTNKNDSISRWRPQNIVSCCMYQPLSCLSLCIRMRLTPAKQNRREPPCGLVGARLHPNALAHSLPTRMPALSRRNAIKDRSVIGTNGSAVV